MQRHDAVKMQNICNNIKQRSEANNAAKNYINVSESKYNKNMQLRIDVKHDF